MTYMKIMCSMRFQFQVNLNNYHHASIRFCSPKLIRKSKKDFNHFSTFSFLRKVFTTKAAMCCTENEMMSRKLQSGPPITRENMCKYVCSGSISDGSGSTGGQNINSDKTVSDLNLFKSAGSYAFHRFRSAFAGNFGINWNFIYIFSSFFLHKTSQ